MCGSDVSMIRFSKEKNEKILKKKEIVCFFTFTPTYLPTSGTSGTSGTLCTPGTYIYLPTYLMYI